MFDEEAQERYANLFDLGRSAGVGVELWAKSVRRQLTRVVRVNALHRHNHAMSDETGEPGEQVAPPPHPEAHDELHAEVYLLVMAMNRVRRFVELMSKFTEDDRLKRLLADFDETACPGLKDVRDYYEHLDEYVLGSGKHQIGTKRRPPTMQGRVSPVLQSEWRSDDVCVTFGGVMFNVVPAALATVELAQAAAPIYEEHIAAAVPQHPEPPDHDDGVERMWIVNFRETARVGRPGDGVIKANMVLRDTYVRPASEAERARNAEKRARGEEP